MDIWTLDFETEAIDGYIPPVPVSLAVMYPDSTQVFYSWGHPDSPNPEGDLSAAKDLLYKLCRDKEHMLFHNAKFDLGVMQYHWHIGPRDPLLVHDTMFLLFFHDPYSPNLSLKPSAERILNWEPEEQDAIINWVLAHGYTGKASEAGAFIARVPHPIVKPYALGDVERTRALFDLLFWDLMEKDFGPAYMREQLLLPILYAGEQRGIRIDRDKLEQDVTEVYEPTLIKVEQDLRTRLLTPELDFGKRDLVADALEHGGFIGQWVSTKTGRRSTSKENLERAVNNPEILHLLRYRGALAGILQTFGRPWLEDTKHDGRLHTSWNQVRTRGGSDDKGARTGRLSASRPNLMNIPNELKIVIPEGYPVIPFMRRYMLPEEGHVWLKRDFSSQEIRWVAHFEDGTLMSSYQENPDMDPHQTALELIHGLTGKLYERKQIKMTAFSIVYGSGVPGLSKTLGVSMGEAGAIKDGYFGVFPGIRTLSGDTRKIGDRYEYITTWGGRRYVAERSVTSGGGIRKFSYKLLNYLIQGSAADQTKDCIIDWDRNRAPDDVFLATVHDEVNISAPEGGYEVSMGKLKASMNRGICDVPMRSDGFVGPNWFDLEETA